MIGRKLQGASAKDSGLPACRSFPCVARHCQAVSRKLYSCGSDHISWLLHVATQNLPCYSMMFHDIPVVIAPWYTMHSNEITPSSWPVGPVRNAGALPPLGAQTRLPWSCGSYDVSMVEDPNQTWLAEKSRIQNRGLNGNLEDLMGQLSIYIYIYKYRWEISQWPCLIAGG